MKTEFEVKFVSVNHDAVRAKLGELGAVCEQRMRLMKRAIIEDANGEMQKKESYIRVRDEGDKITLTYKQFDALSVDGAKEIETSVSSFDDTVKIFQAIGFKVDSVQESKRETWKLDDVTVELDEWPWLEPYIEVEGANEAVIRKIATKLGFDWKDAVFGDVMAAYRVQYPHLSLKDSVVSLPLVSFDMALPDLLKSK
jgi:adenylate cyclase, class 2